MALSPTSFNCTVDAGAQTIIYPPTALVTDPASCNPHAFPQLTFAGADANGAPLPPRYIRGPLSAEALAPCVLYEPLAKGLNLTLTTLAFQPEGFSLRYYGGPEAKAQGAAAAAARSRSCPNSPLTGSPALPPRMPGHAPPEPACLNLWNNFNADATSPNVSYVRGLPNTPIVNIINCTAPVGARSGSCIFYSRDSGDDKAALIVIAAPAGPIKITVNVYNENTILYVWPDLYFYAGCTRSTFFFKDGDFVRPGARLRYSVTTPALKGNGNVAVIYWYAPRMCT
eukprot:tig00020603_g11742.t1